MALLGTLAPCKGCGKVLRPTLSDRPLLRKVRSELIREGLLPASGVHEDTSPAPH